MKNDLEVGNRIRAIREELNMTRSVFSENINISESYLTQLELGHKSLGMNTLLAICKYTNCSADYLLFGKEENNQLNHRIIRILSDLSPNALNLAYEMIRSIKNHSDF